MFPILNERKNQVAETTVIQTGNPILSGDGDCKDLCNSELVKSLFRIINLYFNITECILILKGWKLNG